MSRSNGGKGVGGGRELPARFYKAVTIAPAASGQFVQACRILLDGTPMRTPAKQEFAVPTRALAAAIAAEWEAQRDRIDPETMPLTRLANSAIDGVADWPQEVRSDIANFALSDLVCYRAEAPAELVRRQREAWDPIVEWGGKLLGVALAVTTGVIPVAQPRDTADLLVRRLEDLDAFTLAAVHVMTTLTGSALLALARVEGHIDAAATWAAAHIDEDFQAEKWGIDPEAAARRQRRWVEMQAADRLLQLRADD